MSRSAARLHLSKKRRAKDYFFNQLVLVVAFAEPLSTAGQIWQIWKYKDVKGNSLATWLFFDVSAVIWLVYALKIKNKPLIITEFLWAVAQTIVIYEIIYYS